jgi:hypothetical protein
MHSRVDSLFASVTYTSGLSTATYPAGAVEIRGEGLVKTT